MPVAIYTRSFYISHLSKSPINPRRESHALTCIWVSMEEAARRNHSFNSQYSPESPSSDQNFLLNYSVEMLLFLLKPRFLGGQPPQLEAML